MSELNREIEALLREKGADMVGFARLEGVAGAAFPVGVAVAVKLPPAIVRSISDGPNPAYYEMYHEINARLDDIVTAGASSLTDRGYRAVARTKKSVALFADSRTDLPHKTVAVRAGLGWIGKCALLVTEEFGSAVRISALVTDAPLSCAEPVALSRCGRCDRCAADCPAGAVTGETWRAGMPREALFDAARCRDTARALSAARIGKEATLCGKCIEICPYTQRYLRRAGG